MSDHLERVPSEEGVSEWWMRGGWVSGRNNILLIREIIGTSSVPPPSQQTMKFPPMDNGGNYSTQSPWPTDRAGSKVEPWNRHQTQW